MPTRLLASAVENQNEAAHGTELPIPPIAFGLIALGVFVGLFLLLWAFRSVANKH
jgi:hypothetical protein